MDVPHTLSNISLMSRIFERLRGFSFATYLQLSNVYQLLECMFRILPQDFLLLISCFFSVGLLVQLFVLCFLDQLCFLWSNCCYLFYKSLEVRFSLPKNDFFNMQHKGDLEMFSQQGYKDIRKSNKNYNHVAFSIFSY